MDSNILDVNDNPGPSDSEVVSEEDKKTKKGGMNAKNVDLPVSPTTVETKATNETTDSSYVVKGKASKNRKKADCNVQHVLRALNSLVTPEEKLAALCQKYSDLFEENRKLQVSAKQFEKQLSAVVKEKDRVRSDLAKSILTRSRLENLCRELQRQNKEIKEESSQKIREEEQKRKEVSAKFQTTLQEITELMKEDNDKTLKLRDDNIDMTTKLKSISERCEMREQQMSLESQLYEARLAKLEMESSAEKEILLREKQQLLVTLTEYQAKFQEYQNIEMALRNQVALYNSKYEEFEKSLTRSNNMFGNFKEEMENMSNKIVKLETESVTWKQRWEETQKALLEVAAEKQKSDQEIITTTKQLSALRKLCRTLQTERTQLLAKLNISETSAIVEATDQNPSSCNEFYCAADTKNKSEHNSPVKKNENTIAEKKVNKRNQKSKLNQNEVKSSGDTAKQPDPASVSENTVSAALLNLNLNSAVKVTNENSDTVQEQRQEDSVAKVAVLDTACSSPKPLENGVSSDLLNCEDVKSEIHSESCNSTDSQNYELKKSTHSSKTKNSPKKKNKK